MLGVGPFLLYPKSSVGQLCHQECCGRKWLILLPTVKTKNIISNIPCSFNNSLEICHLWLCLNLFEDFFFFLLLVNRSFLCNEFSNFTTGDLTQSPGFTTVTSFTSQIHSHISQHGHFWQNQSHQEMVATPITHMPHTHGAWFCHSLLFSLKNLLSTE